MNIDGSDQRRLSTGPGGDGNPDYSPDGRTIVFASAPDNQLSSLDIYLMNADGSGVRRLTQNKARDWDAEFGPDNRIVFSSDRDGDLEIYVMNPDGSNVIRLTDSPYRERFPTFNPSGTKIAFVLTETGTTRSTS